ncbi:MAG: AEC family transporter [Rubrivivax sp.]|nr:AEC family transporter [Rubrivivax sp.]
MTDALLLLPDFALILTGFAVCRWTPLGRTVWDGAERLVYYMLFPALLFTAIARNPLRPGDALPLAVGALGVTALGIALALSLRRWPGVSPALHASGAQVAFRFNSYVALAVVERMTGAPGLASIAVVVSLVVPLCNVAAVWPLAQHGRIGYGRELLRNPLILATGSGLVFNMLGLQLPTLAATTLQRMGGAALPLGLLAVGAGLRLGALRDGPALAGALLAIRHLLLPVAALAYAIASGLPPVQQTVLVVFSALPTATSAYVLAARMGGRGDYVAGLVTVSTLLGMLSLPLALMALAALR